MAPLIGWLAGSSRVKSGAVRVMVNAWVAMRPVRSVTWTVKPLVPAMLGVPVSWPVAASRPRPGGRALVGHHILQSPTWASLLKVKVQKALLRHIMVLEGENHYSRHRRRWSELPWQP